MHRTVLLLNVLALAGCFSVSSASKVYAQVSSGMRVNRIVVVDDDRRADTLQRPMFERGEEFEGTHGRNTFEVHLEDSEAPFLWVSFVAVRRADFEDNGKRIILHLHNGSQIRGRFPYDELTITGDAADGRSTYEVDDIRSVEMVDFRSGFGPSEEIVAAGEAWERFSQSWNSPGAMWRISDGQTVVESAGIGFRDRYYSNYSGMTITNRRAYYDGYSTAQFKVLDPEVDSSDGIMSRENPEKTISFSRLRSLRITGERQHERPKAVIGMLDGEELETTLAFRKEHRGEAGAAINTTLIYFDQFDEDDVLYWKVSFGYAGVSLKPERTILVERIGGSEAGEGSPSCRIGTAGFEPATP